MEVDIAKLSSGTGRVLKDKLSVSLAPNFAVKHEDVLNGLVKRQSILHLARRRIETKHSNLRQDRDCQGEIVQKY
jgi:hypothetical protein